MALVEVQTLFITRFLEKSHFGWSRTESESENLSFSLDSLMASNRLNEYPLKMSALLFMLFESS